MSCLKHWYKADEIEEEKCWHAARRVHILLFKCTCYGLVTFKHLTDQIKQIKCEPVSSNQIKSEGQIWSVWSVENAGLYGFRPSLLRGTVVAPVPVMGTPQFMFQKINHPLVSTRLFLVEIGLASIAVRADCYRGPSTSSQYLTNYSQGSSCSRVPS